MTPALLLLCLAADLTAAQAARDAGELELALELVEAELATDAGPTTLAPLALRGAIHVERGDLDAARADFSSLLEADPDYELPDNESRRVRGFFRLTKTSASDRPAPDEARGFVARPEGPPGARPEGPPPSVKRPNTLAIEEPTSLDVLWWTVAGVSAGAIIVTAILAGIAAAAPSGPSTSLGRIELPLR